MLVHRLRSLLRRGHVEDSLAREIDLHLSAFTRELMGGGMSETDAKIKARRQFGSIDVTKEQCRDMRRVNFIEDLARDLERTSVTSSAGGRAWQHPIHQQPGQTGELIPRLQGHPGSQHGIRIAV
jgi:hypothetical protein